VEPLSPRMRNDGGKHQLNDYNSLASTGARPTSTVIMKQMGWFGVAIGFPVNRLWDTREAPHGTDR
jgi:hypothetical protein